MSTVRSDILSFTEPVPALEAGDRLTRAEFERRYRAMPSHVKAELIDGVVHMASPVRFRSHGQPHVLLATWMGTYAAVTPGVEVADNTTTRLDLDNEPQPDLAMFIDPARGGRVTISDDDYLEGAPDLVAEIASSSVSIDLHAKLHAYRRSGVREYLVWRVQQSQIDWFENIGGELVQLPPDPAGIITSKIFPGLRLDVPALLAGRHAAVLDAVRLGTQTAEHATFVRSLQK
jgi:Uma2 family endonuclease